MPVRVQPEELRQFTVTDQAPAAHLDLLDTLGFRSAVAGLRLGVFEALAAGPLPVADLARRTGTDAYALRLLADALVGFGYLTGSATGYANSTNTTRWLLRDAPESFAPVLAFWGAVVTERWTDLEESIAAACRAGTSTRGWSNGRKPSPTSRRCCADSRPGSPRRSSS